MKVFEEHAEDPHIENVQLATTGFHIFDLFESPPVNILARFDVFVKTLDEVCFLMFNKFAIFPALIIVLIPEVLVGRVLSVAFG